MKIFVQHLVLILCFSLLAGLLLFPLPLHLSDGILAAQSGDPLMQVWAVQWNIHKLTTSLSNYFDANIFYPYANTFAYHDHMFALGVFGLPIFTLTHNPILTYNLLLLASFALSAYGMFLFCKELTGNGYAAFLAGLIFGFLPYRFAHLDHLNLLSVQWMPFCLLFLTRYLLLKQRTIARLARILAGFWGFYLLQVLTSFNYLFMLTYMIGIVSLATLFFQWKSTGRVAVLRTKREILFFLVSLCLAGIILLPFLLPYLQANQEMGFQRTLEEAVALSAQARNYLAAPRNNRLYGKITERFASAASPFPREQMLFGGIVPAALALIGLAGMFFKHKAEKPLQRLHVLRSTYGVLLLIAAILSLGPYVRIAGNTFSLPYLWLYHLVPGFKAMRVPARFGLPFFWAMSALAAIGATSILHKLRQPYARPGYYPGLKQLAFTALLGGCILLEYASLPHALSFYPATPETIPSVYRWLAEQPQDIRIIELPLDAAKRNFEYTYYSTFHWKRLVNGRSAFIPQGIADIFQEMRRFPSERAVTLLKTLGVDYVIAHNDAFDAQDVMDRLPPGITLVHQFGDDRVFALTDREPGVWQNSAKFRSVPFAAQAILPSMLRPGERAGAGIELKPPRVPFSPLPYERVEIELEWEEQTGITRMMERQEIRLPALIDGTMFSFPFMAPTAEGEYQVRLHSGHPLMNAFEQTFSISVLSDMPDSRGPATLQARFLKIAMPDVWQAGKPLPVQVFVKNTGDTLWRANVRNPKNPVGEVHLAVTDWRHTSSGEVLANSHPQLFIARGFLLHDVAPGQETRIEMLLRTPELSGEFFVKFHLVSELIQWFSSEPMSQKIRLK